MDRVKNRPRGASNLEIEWLNIKMNGSGVTNSAANVLILNLCNEKYLELTLV